jgi:hypothetical protein
MNVRKGTLLSEAETIALGADRKRNLEPIPEVEGQEMAVLYVECPSCKVVSRLTVDTEGPMWGLCSGCHSPIRP